MSYQFSAHALRDRLKERTNLTREEIEAKLGERRYVVTWTFGGSKDEHHLIWDETRQHLIDVPITPHGVIPTIRPVTYGSGYTEWQRAEAVLRQRLLELP